MIVCMMQARNFQSESADMRQFLMKTRSSFWEATDVTIAAALVTAVALVQIGTGFTSESLNWWVEDIKFEFVRGRT